MSDATLLGLPRPFEFKGHKYLVAPRDTTTETVFAEWCKAEAALDLWRLKPRIPADFYAEQMKLYNAKVCGKRFRWGAEDVHSIYWSDDGQSHMLWLKITRGAEKGGEPIERVTVDAIAADPDKWHELQRIMWEQDEPDFFAELTREEAKTKEAAPHLAHSPPPQPGSLPGAPTSPTVPDSTAKT